MSKSHYNCQGTAQDQSTPGIPSLLDLLGNGSRKPTFRLGTGNAPRPLLQEQEGQKRIIPFDSLAIDLLLNEEILDVASSISSKSCECAFRNEQRMDSSGNPPGNLIGEGVIFDVATCWVKSSTCSSLQDSTPKQNQDSKVKKLNDTFLSSQDLWMHVPEPTPLKTSQTGNLVIGRPEDHTPRDQNQLRAHKTPAVTPPASPSPQQPNSTSTEARFRDHQRDQWNQQYLALVKFRKRYGHCNVPHQCHKFPELARWVKRQRHQYRLRLGECGQEQASTSTMTLDRFHRLEALGFEWKRHESLWQTRFEELVEFRRLHGHVLVPSSYPQNPKLVSWVKQQRRQFRIFLQGQSSTMTLEHKEKLQSVGFGWSLRQRRT